MKKRFDLTAKTAQLRLYTHNYVYDVYVPQYDGAVRFSLVFERNKTGRTIYPRIEVESSVIVSMACEMAFYDIGAYGDVDEIQKILINAPCYFGDWFNLGKSGMKFYLRDSFLGLLPKKHVHELENEELGNGRPRIKFDWDEIDWFDEKVVQHCLPYVEDLLNMAVDYCIKEFKKVVANGS